MTEQLYIKGQLNHMIFHNAEKQFSIASIKLEETNLDTKEDEFVVKGHLPKLTYGNDYIFYGKMESHPRFGDQFQVFTYEKELPKTEESLIRYLASDLFYGIGLKTAKKIVGKLGIDTVEKVLKDETVLDGIVSMKKETKQQFIQDLRLHQGFDRVTVELSKYGIGLQLAQKIYALHQEKTLDVLTENPYQLVFQIEGFGFQRADEIAQQIGIRKDHPTRIQAGILHVLEEESLNGHVFVYEKYLIRQASELLFSHGTNGDFSFDIYFQSLIEESLLVKENDRIYLPQLYFAEEGIASQLARIQEVKEDATYAESELLKLIGDLEEREGISYGEEQYEAIKMALDEKVMILTGGPGTGKTTVVKGILESYQKLCDKEKTIKDSDYLLCAPTGRAAKRLSESTGMKAKTIHSLLGWSGENEFEYDAGNQLDGKLIIIDEFSMVDVWLANRLVKAIPSSMKVILVGDEDQLPSVGPGEVLSDLLKSDCIKVARLEEIYRQKEDSSIIKLAHAIKNDRFEELDLSKSSDFNFFPTTTENTAVMIEKIVERALAKGYTQRDIQVLAPMYRSKAGIHALNEALQQLFNPPSQQKREIKHFDSIYRSGDKVIQLVNQPEKKVFNGDIGEIRAIKKPTETETKKEEMIVDFEGLEVSYTRQDFNQLMLAYAISIHKSQGSEFPIVIIPIVRSFRRMLVKNLIYTAITRGKSSLIICGEHHELMDGLRQKNFFNRNTTLVERLKHVWGMSVDEIDRNAAIEVSDSAKELSGSQDEASSDKIIETKQVKPKIESEDDYEGLPLEDAEKHDDGLSPYDFMD
uniref:SF1B family DNA helicase RecD2 n=1 Tax=uncultured Allobacillus sp. TaxID=1638025 RepID=UPI0025989493|nr:ATP-dependent RecD-like DNA helicase [uncultured Allobacillus sp.]